MSSLNMYAPPSQSLGWCAQMVIVECINRLEPQRVLFFPTRRGFQPGGLLPFLAVQLKIIRVRGVNIAVCLAATTQVEEEPGTQQLSAALVRVSATRSHIKMTLL